MTTRQLGYYPGENSVYIYFFLSFIPHLASVRLRTRPRRLPASAMIGLVAYSCWTWALSAFPIFFIHPRSQHFRWRTNISRLKFQRVKEKEDNYNKCYYYRLKLIRVRHVYMSRANNLWLLQPANAAGNESLWVTASGSGAPRARGDMS